MRNLFLLLLAAWAFDAKAYCIYNQLADRSLQVLQETDPDKLREDRRLKATIPPGSSHCCPFHRLDCNPGGRNNSVVNLSIKIPGDPPYSCGFPEGATHVKVTGSGTVRVQKNTRQSAYPYIVRISTHDRQNLTGPKGLACPEDRSKGSR